MKNFRHREDGNSIIEFALLLPVFLMIVLGTFDMGRGFNTYISMTNAAREGARWLTTHADDVSGAQARIEAEAAQAGLAASDITVEFTPDKTDYQAGETVAVKVSHNYDLLFGVIPSISEITLSAQVTMTMLYD